MDQFWRFYNVIIFVCFFYPLVGRLHEIRKLSSRYAFTSEASLKPDNPKEFLVPRIYRYSPNKINMDGQSHSQRREPTPPLQILRADCARLTRQLHDIFDEIDADLPGISNDRGKIKQLAQRLFVCKTAFCDQSYRLTDALKKAGISEEAHQAEASRQRYTESYTIRKARVQEAFSPDNSDRLTFSTVWEQRRSERPQIHSMSDDQSATGDNSAQDEAPVFPRKVDEEEPMTPTSARNSSALHKSAYTHRTLTKEALQQLDAQTELANGGSVQLARDDLDNLYINTPPPERDYRDQTSASLVNDFLKQQRQIQDITAPNMLGRGRSRGGSVSSYRPRERCNSSNSSIYETVDGMSPSAQLSQPPTRATTHGLPYRLSSQGRHPQSQTSHEGRDQARMHRPQSPRREHHYHRRSRTPPKGPSLVVPQYGSERRHSTGAENQQLAHHILKSQMFNQKDIVAFDGCSTEFRSWMLRFRAKAYPKGVPIFSAYEEINALEVHTDKEPRRVVKNFAAAFDLNPEEGLRQIWKTLHSRYGCDSKVAVCVRKQLDALPRLSASSSASELQRFSDTILVAGQSVRNVPQLSDFNQAPSLRPIREKLPEDLQLKWQEYGASFEEAHGYHPSFSLFVAFVQRQTEIKCNDNYSVGTGARKMNNASSAPHQSGHHYQRSNQPSYRSHATKAGNATADQEFPTEALSIERRLVHQCCVHESNEHPLDECPTFIKMSIDERYDVARNNHVCFRCFRNHRGGARNCTSKIRCKRCSSNRHNTLLHADVPRNSSRSSASTNTIVNANEAEVAPNAADDLSCSSTATDIIDAGVSETLTCTTGRKLCGKVFLVHISAPERSDKVVKTYAMLDDCSDATFCDESLIFALDAPYENVRYSLSTLERVRSTKSGLRVCGLRIKGVLNSQTYHLPPTLSSDALPDATNYLPDPEAVRRLPHGRTIAHHFPDIDPDATLTVLIGRNAEHLMHIQTIGETPPFIQKTRIGHCVVGKLQSSAHGPDTGSADTHGVRNTVVHPISIEPRQQLRHIDDVFALTDRDEQLGLSVEDRKFLALMRSAANVDSDGHFNFPLPFKCFPPRLPDSKLAVVRRMSGTIKSLRKRPKDFKDTIASFQVSLDEGHVEPLDVSPFEPDIRGDFGPFYLNHFPVRHPKTGKLRVVYDAATRHGGTSLNDRLMSGPDVNNALTSIIIRFREDIVAVSADVRQMFNQFRVTENHRDFLRLIWLKGNDPEGDLSVFRARVHIFGARSSPAVAISGLRMTCEPDPEIHDFASSSFYVDDLLGATHSVESAVDLMSRTKSLLATRGLLLHKVVSNSKEVLESFDVSALVPDLVDIDINDAPLQRSLGIAWDVSKDVFAIRSVIPAQNSFTRRSLLSIISSVFDPCGWLSPVVLHGRTIMRKIMQETKDAGWDDQLPERFRPPWNEWLESLKGIESLNVRRCFYSVPSTEIVERSLHTFVDASKDGIGFTVYLRSVDRQGNVDVYLIVANSKLTPKTATTIPRLELCSCVEGARAANIVSTNLKHKVQSKHYYCDSQVALAFLANESRRFSVFVANRIALVQRLTDSGTWGYVPTDINPADFASRPTTPESLRNSRWLIGPDFLYRSEPTQFSPPMPKVTLESLPEQIKSSLAVCATGVKRQRDSSAGIFEIVFVRNSRWVRIVNIACAVLRARDKFLQRRPAAPALVSSIRRQAEIALVKDAQRFSGLRANDQNLAPLAPMIGRDGAIRVGGRLQNATLHYDIKHPLLVPHTHPIAAVIVCHFHRQVHHQGRIITSGEVASNGYFVTKASMVVRRTIQACVPCKRYRGQPSTQIMGPLPKDRLEQSPVFTFVGVDCFGPFMIKDGPVTRRTVQRKINCLIFVCQASRAIHLEVLHQMSTNSFLLAFRRFQALRGACVKEIRSDRGTNFVGSTSEPDAGLNVAEVAKESENLGVTWKFNPPLASNQGGSWERKIQSVRKVFVNALSALGNKLLSLEEFQTLMIESAAIVNNTPLTAHSDAEVCVPISPAMLLHGTGSNPLTPAPFETFTEEEINAYGRRRWRSVQALANVFWSRWSTEYRQFLLERAKWFIPARNLRPGDIVLSTEKSGKRNDWRMGLVTDVIPGSDGHVRSVKVKFTNGKTLERVASTLVLYVASE